MRVAFVDTLTELMRKHDDIIALTADMGFSVFEGIQKEFPKRFFNTGVTEQSTISLASGMALSGYKVFVYAQAIFMTLRCFEQVRLDVCYQNANVKIIGTAAGFWLNQLGVSHFALEDVGAIRLLPNMKIFTPGDPYEARWAVQTAYETNGPAYVRLAKPDRQFVHSKPLVAKIGDIIPISGGKHAALLAGGNLLPMAVEIQKRLLASGVSAAVYSVPTIKPISKRDLLKILKKYPHVITLEEHSMNGGLGTVVSEFITDNAIWGVTLTRFGTPDTFIHVTGSREYLLGISGLSVPRLANKIKSMLPR